MTVYTQIILLLFICMVLELHWVYDGNNRIIQNYPITKVYVWIYTYVLYIYHFYIHYAHIHNFSLCLCCQRYNTWVHIVFSMGNIVYKSYQNVPPTLIPKHKINTQILFEIRGIKERKYILLSGFRTNNTILRFWCCWTYCWNPIVI